jgi:hypothetical protein
MATITTTGSGNWSSATPDAPWPGGTKPTTGDNVEIAAGHTVTLDENTAVLGSAGIKNVSGSNTSVLDVSGTRTINGCVSHSGTATGGFVTLGTGDALTINYTGGAGTTAVTNSSSGYAIVVSGSGTLSVSNSGGIALKNTSTGRAVYHNSTGTCDITGSVQATSSRPALDVAAASTGVTITGNINSCCTNGGWATVYIWAAATVSVVGDISATYATGWLLYVGGGTTTWIGSRTVNAAEECSIQVAAGTLALASGSGALALANNGTVHLWIATAGTLTTTSGGNTAAITNRVVPSASAGSYSTISGGTAANKGIIAGPVLPAASNVRLSGSSQYGYASALFDGTISMPNSGTPTGTEDATSDACVVSGKNYGAANARTGTASAGSGGSPVMGGMVVR